MLYCSKQDPSHFRKLVVASAEEPGPDNVCFDCHRFNWAMCSKTAWISVLAWVVETGLDWGSCRRSNGPTGVEALGEEALGDEVGVVDAGASARGILLRCIPRRRRYGCIPRGDRDRATETLGDGVAVMDAGVAVPEARHIS